MQRIDRHYLPASGPRSLDKRSHACGGTPRALHTCQERVDPVDRAAGERGLAHRDAELGLRHPIEGDRVAVVAVRPLGQVQVDQVVGRGGAGPVEQDGGRARVGRDHDVGLGKQFAGSFGRHDSLVAVPHDGPWQLWPTVVVREVQPDHVSAGVGQ